MGSEFAGYLKAPSVGAEILAEKATGVVGGKRTYGDVILLGLGETQPMHKKLQDARAKLQKAHPEVTRVLVEVGARKRKGYRVTLRAVKTRDFLTVEVVDVPWKTLGEAAEKILEKCPKVSSVYYDVTPKPPATVEFE
jgi:GMP synthase (glutamine-hydrolysing)